MIVVRVLLMLFVLWTGLASSAAVTNKEIEEALTCQCGCGLTVHSCNHLSCPSGIPLRQEAAALVSEGRGRDEILLAFREKYGEKILAAPTTEGFNLTAWVLPFLMLAAGTLVVIGTVRRWAARGAEAGSGEAAPAISSEDRQRIEAELRREDA